jgi:hypothetical protein
MMFNFIVAGFEFSTKIYDLVLSGVFSKRTSLSALECFEAGVDTVF